MTGLTVKPLPRKKRWRFFTKKRCTGGLTLLWFASSRASARWAIICRPGADPCWLRTTHNEAGFSPLEAIHIATENGAIYLGREDRIGTLAPGKQADIVLIKGDPSKKIEDIENVETVFKAGVGYDSQKLIDSVKGQVGIR